MVGPAAQDYLKIIYKLRQQGRVSPSDLAERLAVSPAAVTKMLKRLAELNLVNYTKHQELDLTPSGEKVALEMIRHHRLLELYLAEALGYGWDQVDAEAGRLEHVISEEFEDRIDELLGFPTHDPHGDPIPTRDGRIEPVHYDTLTELEPGLPAIVSRVQDGNPEMLRYLGALGLRPEADVEVLSHAPFGGPITVRVGESEHAIGRELADNVFVSARRTEAK